MFKIFLVLILYIYSASAEEVEVDLFASPKGVRLVGSDKYILDVTQQFIYELEDYGVCNTKLEDMTQNISRANYFGYDLFGTVYYTNGFLSTFQEVSLAKDPMEASIDQDRNSASMSMELIFSSLIMFYDYSANLTAGTFSGTVAVPMNTMRIELSVIKFFGNDTIVHDLRVTGSQAALVKVWDFEPSNHYTEIINKDIKLDFASSEKNIEVLWNKLLGRAIKAIPFPQMCFMC